jgi:hypothetical protein
MEAEAAKYIGAGIACLGMGGAGIGLGTSSATTSPALCAIRPQPTASSAA